MKKIFVVIFTMFLVTGLFANPLNYIQERGWKETEKTKEMNLRYHHAYILEGKAFLMWSQNGDKYFIYVYSTDDEEYAVYVSDKFEDVLKAMRSISKHQIPNVEWVLTKDFREVINGTRETN